jgi:outer membrane protein TolC
MSAITVLSRIGFLLLAAGVPVFAQAQPELTLAEAERLALAQAPWLAHHRTNVEAVAERAEYEGRLPDPQLTLGVINVPTDGYRLNQEDMTMVNVGVRQMFPPGDTLKLRSQRAEKELTREQARLEMERRNLLRQVRLTWLELYYQEQALRLLTDSRELAARQLADAEGRYRAAQEPQQVFLKQRQVLARLMEREPMLRAQIVRLRGQLARWVGDLAHQPLPDALPELTPLAESFDPTRHPDWLAAQAGLEAAQTEVALTRQEYKPGMTFDLSYGARQATPDGRARPDMVTALVTFDLPIFRAKRQDRRLSEKQTLEVAARWETEDKRRDLQAQYDATQAEHGALTRRAKIISDELLPAIQREARVAAGIARDQSERREAQLKELDTQLELLRLHVDTARSQAELHYLTGETTP